MLEKSVSVLVFMALTSMDSNAVEGKAVDLEQVIDFVPNESGNLLVECASSLWSYDAESKTTLFSLTPERDRKRCEFAFKGLLNRDSPFSISFSFKVSERYDDPDNWHSYFQIHSFPDEGEEWRCPILALESIGGKLRMYNRWDTHNLSITDNGTCADFGNTIESRVLFLPTDFELEGWNKMTIEGLLSTTEDGWLNIYLNDEQISESNGPNTFNDVLQPYFKIGIYKPTSWGDNSHIQVEFKDVEYR